MKVTGSVVESISASFKATFESAERVNLKLVTERLSKEGKHVINIIHGTPILSMGQYQKTITYIWEADDTDPVYVAAMDKAKAEEERERIANEIRQKEKRKNQAEFVKRGMKPSIKLIFGVLLAILGYVVVFLLGDIIDSIIVAVIGGVSVLVGYVLAILGIIGLMKYKIRKDVKKEMENEINKNN